MSKDALRKTFIVVASCTSAIYLLYRIFFTLNLTTPYAISISLFLWIGESFGVLSMFLYFLQVWKVEEPAEQPVLEGRTVDVFVPTYNEDIHLLRTTLQACVDMDYPHRTYVLDDGRRPEVATLAQTLGVHYVTRPDNLHAKAGNLNHALERTEGEFVVILDADHVPAPNFITRLLGYFQDDRLGYVQTPHAFYNFDSFQARLNHEKKMYWDEGEVFYNVIQPGRNHWNASIFAGSAAMFRRQALEEVGYIAVETITEDIHTGMRIHAQGWKSLGISERLVAGQAASDVTTFHSQRLRWGEGNLSVMAHDNPLIMPGLTPAQRLCYFGSMIHWAGGLFKLAIYLTPILMLFSGVPPVAEFSWTLFGISLTYLLVTWGAIKAVSNGHGSIVNSELFSMLSFYTQARGTLRALFWRKFQTFVVTSKRGRQSKSIWHTIYPHVYLIALSVLAVLWGWSRPILGISDDYYKPILPTIWVFFHALLALFVIRRAHWPENHRFAYRHIVHLPVLYEAGDELKETRMGITTDLSETGLSLIAYERIPPGSTVQLSLRGAGETITCAGEVQSVKELGQGARPAALPFSGCRHGVAFRDLSPEQGDALNRVCLRYAVPRLYDHYANRRTRGQKIQHYLATRSRPRRAAKWYPCRFPIKLEPLGSSTGPLYGVTERINRNSLRVLLDAALPVDAEVNFLLATPLGEVRGQARIMRTEPLRLMTREFQMCVLQFLHFEGQGRGAVQSFCGSSDMGRCQALLNPQRVGPAIPVKGPLVFGMLALCPFIAAELGLLHFVYRDDLFLSGVVAARDLNASETFTRIDAIYQETVQDSYPSTDRLVLLMKALARANCADDIDRVTQLLAPRDRRNLDMQLALAHSYDHSKEYHKAETVCELLLQKARKSYCPSSKKQELLLSAARCNVHAGNLETAIERFRELLREAPDDLALRTEIAGVLTSARRFDEAVKLFAQARPDLDGRLLLVTIHALANNYDEAEAECRSVLRAWPNDPGALSLLAEVLLYKKGYAQSQALYERILRTNVNDPKIRLKLAQVALWNKNYNQALDRFQALMNEGREDAELTRGFIDAAASADKLGDNHRQTSQKLFDALRGQRNDDPVYLARLAWVLERLKEYDKCFVLLDRALVKQPDNPVVRKQYVGALTAAGRWDEARVLLERAGRDLDARYLLTSIYLKDGAYAAAEKECRSILNDHPEEIQAESLLADLLSWRNEYQESLEILGKLAHELPDDRRIQVRRAEVLLWSKNYPEALEHYQTLLDKQLDQPVLWRGFVDAAAGVKTLRDEHRRTLLRIFESSEKSEYLVRRSHNHISPSPPAASGEVGMRVRGVGVQIPPSPPASGGEGMGVRGVGVQAKPWSLLQGTDAVFLTRLGWLLFREKEREKCLATLDQAAQLDPQDPAVRKELAGVLAAAGRTKASLRMFDGVPLEVHDRFILVGLHATEKNYAAAENQCRTILEKKPNDRQAERLLADVLSWKKEFKESLEIIEKLVQAEPDDRALQVRLAEVTLWSHDYSRALERYQDLLDRSFDEPREWAGFVTAAASAPSLPETCRPMVDRVYQRMWQDQPRDVLLLSRLAWVLFRLRESTKCTVLLDRALALKPQEARVKKELAGVLAAAGRYKEALALYEGLALDRADRFFLAALHSALQDFAAAEAHYRALLDERPDDDAAMLLLADVLRWNRRFPEAEELYRKCSAIHPADPVLAVKLAEVALWSGNYETALARYQKILDENAARPDLWEGYINAAASAPKLNAANKKTVLKISEEILTWKSRDMVVMTRLAWVLRRIDEPGKSAALLQHVLAADSTCREVRLSLAEALSEAGAYDEAERHYAVLLRPAQEKKQEAGRASRPVYMPVKR